MRVQVDAAAAHRPDAVQQRIAALEEGRAARTRCGAASLARMESLVDLDRAQDDRPVRADREPEVAETEGLVGLEAIAATAREVAEAGVLVVRRETAVGSRELRGGGVDAGTGGRVEIEHHGARHDLAEIQRDEPHFLAAARHAQRPARRRRLRGKRSALVGEHLRDGVVEQLPGGCRPQRDRAPRPRLAAEQRDRARQQRPVGMARRLVAPGEAERVRSQLERRRPARIVEVDGAPAGREPARVEDLARHRADPAGRDLTEAVGAERAPGGVAREGRGAETRLEHEGAGTELQGGRHRRPPGVGAPEEAREHGDRVGASLQPRCQIDHVVAKPPAVRAHGAARHLHLVHPEHVARVGGEPGGSSSGQRVEREGAPEACRDAVAGCLPRKRRRGEHFDARRLAPDPARGPTSSREVGLAHVELASRTTAQKGSTISGDPCRAVRKKCSRCCSASGAVCGQ